MISGYGKRSALCTMPSGLLIVGCFNVANRQQSWSISFSWLGVAVPWSVLPQIFCVVTDELGSVREPWTKRPNWPDKKHGREIHWDWESFDGGLAPENVPRNNWCLISLLLLHVHSYSIREIGHSGPMENRFQKNTYRWSYLQEVFHVMSADWNRLHNQQRWSKRGCHQPICWNRTAYRNRDWHLRMWSYQTREVMPTADAVVRRSSWEEVRKWDPRDEECSQIYLSDLNCFVLVMRYRQNKLIAVQKTRMNTRKAMINEYARIVAIVVDTKCGWRAKTNDSSVRHSSVSFTYILSTPGNHWFDLDCRIEKAMNDWLPRSGKIWRTWHWLSSSARRNWSCGNETLQNSQQHWPIRMERKCWTLEKCNSSIRFNVRRSFSLEMSRGTAPFSMMFNTGGRRTWSLLVLVLYS